MKRSYKLLNIICSGMLCSSVGVRTFDHYQKPIHIEYIEKKQDVISDRCQQILKYGVPSRSPEVSCYTNHCLCYNQASRTPIWVAEHLNKINQNGSADRQSSNFKSDPNMGIFSSHNNDYKSSGWSRGHMAPAGNNKSDQQAMNDTFYLSNIVPQNYENNAGFWNRFEIYCKKLVKQYDNVYVYSGPLYLPYYDKDSNKKFMKYEVIGDNNVAVPTHLFKIIIAEKNERIDIGAFIVPNKIIPYGFELTDFEVRVSDIEKSIGVTMLPKIDYKNTGSICKNDGCKLMTKYDFDLYVYNRRLSKAKNIDELEKLLDMMQKKGLRPDAYSENVINTKREEFKIKILQN